MFRTFTLHPRPAPQRAYREERQRWQLVAACLEHCELTLTSLRSGECSHANALEKAGPIESRKSMHKQWRCACAA